MRERTDGRLEMGFNELSAAQKRDALAMLPQRPLTLSVCSFCQGRLKPGVVAGRQTCLGCKRTHYAPAWRNDAHKLYWRVSQDGVVEGWDAEIRF